MNEDQQWQRRKKQPREFQVIPVQHAEQHRETEKHGHEMGHRVDCDDGRRWEIGVPEQIPGPNECFTGCEERTTEPAPRENRRKHEHRKIRDIQRDDLVKHEHEHEKLGERHGQRPQESEHRPGVAELKLALHEVPDHL